MLLEVNIRCGFCIIFARPNLEFEQKKKACDSLVSSFYVGDDILRHVPGLKNFTICKTTREKKQPLRLVFTFKEAFAIFQNDNFDVAIQFSKFASLRPNNVKDERELPENVCVCPIYANMQFLVDALQKVLDESVCLDSLVFCRNSEKYMHLECEL